MAVRAPTTTDPFSISAAQTPGEDFHDCDISSVSRFKRFRFSIKRRIEISAWSAKVKAKGLRYTGGRTGASSRRKFEAMARWPLSFVFYRRHRRWVHGKGTWKSGYRIPGASNFHNKCYDAISLPRSNVSWHHRVEEHTGLATSTTYSTLRAKDRVIPTVPKTV